MLNVVARGVWAQEGKICQGCLDGRVGSEEWSRSQSWACSVFSKERSSTLLSDEEHPALTATRVGFDVLSQKGGRWCWMWLLASYGCSDAGWLFSELHLLVELCLPLRHALALEALLPFFAL